MNPKKETPDEPIVARDAAYYRAPGALKARIEALVDAEAAVAREPRARPRWNWSWGMGWMGPAVAAAVAGVLAWNVAMMKVAGHQDQLLAQDVTAAHVRSLMLDNHLNDVVSTDQHTVKPWFEGKIDFAPRVEELRDCGFPLAGGRLDYLDGRPVAAMTYRRRLHVVNLFEWPSRETSRDVQVSSINGYALARWSEGGLQYWAVADIAPDDIREFARCLRHG